MSKQYYQPEIKRGQQTGRKMVNVKQMENMAVQQAAKQHQLPIYEVTQLWPPFLKRLLGFR